ncbi:DNA ligase [Pseudohyphozyma bogoriensis]|nr:DNA ligase [Pseudohyphozyma bogoriensis]
MPQKQASRRPREASPPSSSSNNKKRVPESTASLLNYLKSSPKRAENGRIGAQKSKVAAGRKGAMGKGKAPVKEDAIEELVLDSEEDDDDGKDGNDSDLEIIEVDSTPSTSTRPPPVTPSKALAPIFTTKSATATPAPQPSTSSTRTPLASPTKPPQSSTTLTSDTKPAFFTTTIPSTSDARDRSLQSSPFDFRPSRDINASKWPKGHLPFSVLAEALALINGTKSRLAHDEVIVNLFRVVIELEPESLADVFYLATNRLGPTHEGVELGIGPGVLKSAVIETSSKQAWDAQKLKRKENEGDIGNIAFACKRSQMTLGAVQRLTCKQVFTKMLDICQLKGKDSLKAKTAIVRKLLVSAQGEEIRYLMRILARSLRIGAAHKSMLKGLARAFCLSLPPSRLEEEEEFRVSDEEMDALSTAGGGKKGNEEVMKVVREKWERAERMVLKAWSTHPDERDLMRALVEGGFKDLDKRLPLVPGTPLQSMLAQRARSLEEVVERTGGRPFVGEAKVDGQRLQIHVSDEEFVGGVRFELGEGKGEFWTRLFSKHLEDTTAKYPDLLPTLAGIIERSSTTEAPLKNFILDAEIAAIDSAGHVLPFQELASRGRVNVQMSQITVRVGVFAFDLMLLNGESLLSSTFRTRRQLLRSKFDAFVPPDPTWASWKLIPARSSEENDLDKIAEFLSECIQNHHEGLVIKLLDSVSFESQGTPPPGDASVEEVDELDEEEYTIASPAKPGAERKPKGRKVIVLPATYLPDVRSDSWIKLKKDYMDTIGDTLDLVPIAAWHGDGRKAKYWSPILLGCYNPESEMFIPVCKCMSGFSNKFYEDLNSRYVVDEDSTSRSPFPGVQWTELSPAPSVWFAPREVWKISASGLTLSQVYPAAQGLVDFERGISVRFPKFLAIRDPSDKSPENATTEEEIAELYRELARRPTNKPVGNEEKEVEEESDGQEEVKEGAGAKEDDLWEV